MGNEVKFNTFFDIVKTLHCKSDIDDYTLTDTQFIAKCKKMIKYFAILYVLTKKTPGFLYV